jgi:hypothetical protein
MKTLIPKYNLAALQKKVTKLSKRAMKNGKPPLTLVLGEEKVVKKYENFSLVSVTTWQEIELTGIMPTIEGYTFVTKIEHTEHGNMVKSMDSAVSMKFIAYAPDCEHCKSKRRRKETYILKKEDKEIQVGTECLKNYMTLMSVEYMIMIASLEADMMAAGDPDAEYDERSGGPRAVEVRDVKDFISTAIQAVRQYGWQSSAYGRDSGQMGTGAKTWYHLTARRDRDFQDFGITATENSNELAAAYIEQNLTAKHDNIFMHNIQVILRQGFVSHKEVNMIASCAKQILDVEAVRNANVNKVNEFVGEVGKRIELNLTVDKRIGFDTDYGHSVMLIMSDVDGRQFKTVSSGDFGSAQVGDKVKIKGTIKKHDDYKGTKQTVLTRVKEIVAEVKEAV